MNLGLGFSLVSNSPPLGGGGPLAPVNTVAPALDNTTPSVGDTINCSNGTWVNSPTGFTYQWFQFPSTPISGQTASSYTVQAGDVGLSLFCAVTASNGSGSATANSNATSTIPGGDPLAGITLALRLQTHDGYSATPNATTGLFKTVVVTPAVAEVTNLDSFQSGGVYITLGAGKYFVISDDLHRYCFWFNTGTQSQPDASSDGADTYVEVDVNPIGSDTDSSASFAGTLAAAGTHFNATTGGTLITLTNQNGGVRTPPVNAGVLSTGCTVTTTGADAVMGTAPATQDGDAICEWHDVLGTSGLVAVQSNTMFQPVLRMVSGIPVVRGGSGAFMTITPVVSTAIDNWSMFSGAYTRTGGRVHFSNGDNSGYGQTANGQTTGFGMLLGGVAWCVDGVPELNQWLVCSSIRTSGTLANYSNGIAKGTYPNTPLTPTPSTILFGDFSGTEDVDLTSALLASSAFNSSDQMTVETYLATLNPP